MCDWPDGGDTQSDVVISGSGYGDSFNSDTGMQRHGGSYPPPPPPPPPPPVLGTPIGDAHGPRQQTGGASPAPHNAAAGGEGQPTTPPPQRPPPHCGLINQGATCYMNSLLQLLFHTAYFREAVYKMTTDQDTMGEIPKALQNLFFQMQERRTASTTKCLTDAFGWEERELFVQHDIQELAALLRDNLETKMKGSPAEGAMNRLFTGFGENIVTTVDGSYTSRRRDEFYDVHLPVQNYATMEESFRSLVAKEQLNGGNQYKVEEEGKPAVYKDAEKGYEFRRFPRVMFCHLKRFEMDMMSPTLEMKKVNTRFEFPAVLDLNEFERPSMAGAAGAAAGATPPSSGADAGCAPAEYLGPMKPLSPPSPTAKGEAESSAATGSDAAAAAAAAHATITDGDAIYDLYGVIVHRGGVRSGHYYAFLREWDAAQQQWARWLLYDDDDVREVPPAAAIERNFGGPAYHYVGAREVYSQMTHSAYILAYVRRSETARIFYPISTEVIPRHTQEEFKRVLEQDERVAAEEAIRNRTITVCFVTDDDMSRHVMHGSTELLPIPQREGHMGGRLEPITIEKASAVADLYETAAKAINASSRNVRLWRVRPQFTSHRAMCRPIGVFGHRVDYTTLETALKESMHPNEVQRHWTVYMYVEQARIQPVVPLTNALSCPGLIRDMRMSSLHQHFADGTRPIDLHNTAQVIKFDAADQTPVLAIVLAHPVQMQGLSFRVIGQKQSVIMDIEVVVVVFGPDVGAVGPDGAPIGVDPNEPGARHHAREAQHRPIHNFPYPIRARAFGTSAPTSAVRITLPAPALVQRILIERTAVNHQSSYSRVMPPFMVRDLFVTSDPAALAPFQPAPATGPSLPELGERVAVCFVKSFDPRTSALRYRGPAFLRVGEPVAQALPVLRAVVRADDDAPLLLFIERDHTLTQINVATDIIGRDDLQMLNSTSSLAPILVVQVAPGGKGGLPLLYRHMRADMFFESIQQRRSVTVRRIGAPSTANNNNNNNNNDGNEANTIYLTMQGTWNHSQVCECIGDAVGIAPEYIRLYGAQNNSGNGVEPRTDAERSDAFIMLDTLLNACQWPTSDIFYEPLTIPLKTLESQLSLRVVIRDENGHALQQLPEAVRDGPLEALFPGGTPADAVVREFLTQTGQGAALRHHYGRYWTLLAIGGPPLPIIEMFFHVDIDSLRASSHASLGGDSASLESGSESPLQPAAALPRTFRSNVHLEIRPLRLAGDGERLYPCGHVDYSIQPAVYFGVPWIMSLPSDWSVDEAFPAVLERSGVPADEIGDPQRHGIMMRCDILYSYPNWATKLSAYFDATANRADHPRHLMINHKRPKEKAGSRYVAENAPVLNLEKKKKAAQSPEVAGPAPGSAPPPPSHVV